ncbi:hypothetical protein THAOC_07505 [Thalassiosira oceanica]|uniref:Uncharacterized protein n=1 Tax=Thalassiosira oceanica TaxID=159749 RepID=K0SXD5_THAOC|nr:hypothetical protein THAOC_07505 [Thalassiosira oceanica]|eukprot:EJK71088.1 hypothetical protein THAOC_07505 [Thalassiosira oceanica]
MEIAEGCISDQNCPPILILASAKAVDPAVCDDFGLEVERRAAQRRPTTRRMGRLRALNENQSPKIHRSSSRFPWSDSLAFGLFLQFRGSIAFQSSKPDGPAAGRSRRKNKPDLRSTGRGCPHSIQSAGHRQLEDRSKRAWKIEKVKNKPQHDHPLSREITNARAMPPPRYDMCAHPYTGIYLYPILVHRDERSELDPATSYVRPRDGITSLRHGGEAS